MSLSIALMQQEGGTPDLAVMSITDVTEQLQVRRQLETAQAEQAQLMQQLSSANTRLNETNKELLDANEELQVSNEELVLAHEELQATIEEFETTNEELQATNEELEATNDELRARTSELQEMAHLLESERTRLLEMVELAPFTTLVLRGPRLLVEAFTPRFAPSVEVRAVQNRPLDEVFDLFWQDGAAQVRLAHEVYNQNMTRSTVRVPSREPKDGPSVVRHVVYTMVPSHDAAGRVSGVLIYAVDETERLLKEVEEERQRLQMIFEKTHAALALYDARTARLIMGSPRYLDILARFYRKESSELTGSLFYELTPVAPGDEAIEIWKSVLESNVPLRQPEVHIKLAGDEPETVWGWTLTPIERKEEADMAEYLLVSAVEITEQARVRQQAEELNRLRDEFLSLASHELRTPLTSIQGNAELLHLKFQQRTRAAGSSDQDIQAVDRIIRQANRLNRLIDEMLDATRIQGEVLELKSDEDVNLVEVTRRVIDSYAANGREINLEASTEALIGNWDEAHY